MPYIPQSFRGRLEDVESEPPANVGELTYVLYKTCVDYLRNSAGRYADRAEVIAALENTKLEFYRRQVAPYEDQKIAENGDVY